jgi:hypothetical protein
VARRSNAEIWQREAGIFFRKFFMRIEAPDVPGKAKLIFSVGVRLLLMSGYNKKKQETKEICESKTTRKEIAKRFRVINSLTAF